jgi:peptidyl-prolyl cis-trans isomerase SDCCAG10
MSFQKKLSSAGPEKADTNKQEKATCKLHDIPGCESCHDTTLNPDDDVSDQDWISHKLVFDKDLKGKDLMQRKETVDDYVVIDPREREAKVKQEEYEKKRNQKSKVGPAFRKRDGDHDYSSRKRR